MGWNNLIPDQILVPNEMASEGGSDLDDGGAIKYARIEVLDG